MKTIAIALILGLMTISPPALAEDGNNVLDKAGDLFSGKLESVEFWPYLAYTTKETIHIMGIPVIPKNLRTKCSMRLHSNPEDDTVYKLEMGLEF